VFNVASDRVDFLPGEAIGNQPPVPSPPQTWQTLGLPEPSWAPSSSTWPAVPEVSGLLVLCRGVAAGYRDAACGSEPPAAAADPKPSPQAVVAAVLAQFGDSSVVHGASFGALPKIVSEHLRGNFGPSPQPSHALWLYLDAPLARQPTQKLAPKQIVQQMYAQWEATLVAGAVHDEMCWNREPQLVGWSLSGNEQGEEAFNVNSPSVSGSQTRRRPTSRRAYRQSHKRLT